MTLEYLEVSLPYNLIQNSQLPVRYLNQSAINVTNYSPNLTEEKPINQFRNVLRARSEAYDFGKFVIRSTSKTPRILSKLRRNKTDMYNNYQKLVDYSRKKSESEKVDSMKRTAKYSVSSNNPSSKCLKQIVDAYKTKMLTEVNQDQIAYILLQNRAGSIENMLRNDKDRSEMFSQCVLMDRWVSQEPKSRRSSRCSKARSIKPEVASKHLHLTQPYSSQQIFRRRHFVHSVRRNIQAYSVRNERKRWMKQDNKIVLTNIMRNYSTQIISKTQENAQKINTIIRQIFLQYANSNGQQQTWFTYIDRENIVLFLQHFDFEYSDNDEIRKMVVEKDRFSELDLLEIIHLLFRKQSGQSSVDVLGFLKKNIVDHSQTFLPREKLLFENNKQTIQKLFKSKGCYSKLERLITENIKHRRWMSQKGLTFDEVVEILWNLRVYPQQVTKKKLKFTYLYLQSSKQRRGLSVEDVANLLVLIYILKSQKTNEEILKVVSLIRSSLQKKQT